MAIYKNPLNLTLTLISLTLFSTGCSPILQKDDQDKQDNTQQHLDTDNDGTPDVNDNDIDGDGIDNWKDPDIDGDGIPNTSDKDIDGDDIDNIDDNDIDGDGIQNEFDSDIDGDGITNTSDNDIDGDGIDNIDDNDIDGDGIKNNEDPDIDGDGLDNNSDSDLDGDGIINKDDNDIDGDGIDNKDDPDIDNDGTANTSDQTPGGTTDAGDGTAGTQGTTNQGGDKENGTVNTDEDSNNGTTDYDVIDQSEGLIITAREDVAFSLVLNPITDPSGGVTAKTEQVNLDDVRTTITDNGIALQSFQVVNISINASEESLPLIASLGDVSFVLKIYFQTPGNQSNRKLALQTPDQTSQVHSPLTTDMLASGLHLNKQLFGVQPGFDSYVAILKDESIDNIEVVTEIQFLKEVTRSGTIDLKFALETEGKKAL
ncbi:MAG: hypothetical protein JW915_24405 [Chitinispirillaceae bacterium]|nr:hypothetical protein [Chitinispirillaceae bacterium]